jgi:hypothetical protein
LSRHTRTPGMSRALQRVGSMPFIGIQSCFQCYCHTWQVAGSESRNMRPQCTRLQAAAPDACAHTLAPAGALAFNNAHSSGAAAPPAPYHAFAERALACPCSPRSPTPGGDPGSVYRKKHLPPAWVSIGPMPHTMAVYTLAVVPNGPAVGSPTHPRPSRRGHGPCKSGSPAPPLRCAAHSTQVRSSLPDGNTRAWGCAPSTLRPAPRTVQPLRRVMQKRTPPRRHCRSICCARRAPSCSPCSLRGPRGVHSNNSSNSAAGWAAIQGASPTASPGRSQTPARTSCHGVRTTPPPAAVISSPTGRPCKPPRWRAAPP